MQRRKHLRLVRRGATKDRARRASMYDCKSLYDVSTHSEPVTCAARSDSAISLSFHMEGQKRSHPSCDNAALRRAHLRGRQSLRP